MRPDRVPKVVVAAAVLTLGSGVLAACSSSPSHHAAGSTTTSTTAKTKATGTTTTVKGATTTTAGGKTTTTVKGVTTTTAGSRTSGSIPAGSSSGTVPLGSIPSNTTTTAPVAGAATGPTCTASQLRIAIASENVVGNAQAAVFGITNVSAKRCALAGYPALAMYGTLGPITTHVVHDNVAGTAAQMPQSVVTLAPSGGQASFAASWTPTSTTSRCPDGLGVLVTLPSVSKGINVKTIITACGSTVNVTPLQPNVMTVK